MFMTDYINQTRSKKQVERIFRPLAVVYRDTCNNDAQELYLEDIEQIGLLPEGATTRDDIVFTNPSVYLMELGVAPRDSIMALGNDIFAAGQNQVLTVSA